MNITIYIDNQAGSKDLVLYPPLDKCGELTRLASADVQFVGNGPSGPVLVGVEVKSVPDLLNSAATGRLQADDGQLAAMHAAYDYCWLCVYGDVQRGQRGQLQIRGKWGKFFNHEIGNNPVPFGYLDALIIELAARRVRVVRIPCANPNEPLTETAQWLGVLHRWWSKEWHEHKLVRTFNKANDIPLTPGVPEDVLYRAGVASKLLPGRGGIGYERAIAAAQHFDSVREMVNADAKEWQQVPGVGKVLSKAVVEAVK